MLDYWHWACRWSEGITTDSHPRYAIFMSRLTCCVFDYNREDLMKLRAAILNELVERFQMDSQELVEAVDEYITKRDLEKHVRRHTVAPEVAEKRIEALLNAFRGENGYDLTGTPLFNSHIDAVWEKQKKHLKCLQDPELPDDVSLYSVHHTQFRGGKELNVFHCARGTNLLECCHRWMKACMAGRNYGLSVCVECMN